MQGLAEGLLAGRVPALDHGDVGVALAEDGLDGGGVLAVARALGVDVRAAVVEVVLRGGEAGRDHDEGEDHQHGQHHAADEAREFIEAGQEGAVARLLHEPVGREYERGLEDEDGYHAYHYALRERRAEVAAEAEAHEYEREEAYHRREPAGHDARRGLAEGLRHRLARRGLLLEAFGEAVDEEDGVVERAGQLQHAAGRVRDEAYLAEDEVAARVEHRRDAEPGEDYDGLRPVRGGERQDEPDEEHGYHGYEPHLGHGAGRRVRRGDGVARERARLARYLAHGGHGVYPVLVGDGERVERGAVLIIRLHRALILRLERREHVRGVVQPGHGLHAGHRGEALLYLQRLRERDVPHHAARVRYAAGELRREHAERLGRGCVGREIVRDVVVHRHARLAHGRRNDQQREEREQLLRIAHDEGVEFSHKHRSFHLERKPVSFI